MASRDYVRTGGLGLRLGMDKSESDMGAPSRVYTGLGIVGHSEGSPNFVRIQNGQLWAEVTVVPEGDEILARVGSPHAGKDASFHLPLSIGCRVVLVYLDGEQNEAFIVSRLNDETCNLPGDVAGVQTGAAGKTGDVSGPAPLWTFLKIPGQDLLAIETSGGDMLLHSGGLVHIKASSTVEIEGTVNLGSSPLTPPTGSKVGPNGTTIPGIPAVSALAIPTVTAVVPATPFISSPPIGAPIPGNPNSIVRLKQTTQSNIGIDPAYWAWIAAVGGHPLIVAVAGPPPIALHSAFSSFQSASKHTASD